MDADAFFDALALVPNLRSAAFDDVEMTKTPKGYHFDGLAAPTGVEADLGDFTEEYERGSFRRYLAATKDNIPFLHEHRPSDLMASTRSGRLKLEEDGRGFRARADVVQTPLSERVKALVDSGDVWGMSIGMLVGRGNAAISRRNGGKPHRLIKAFSKILDVSTTFDPSYASTEAQFRSMTMQFAGEPESLQQLLTGAYPQLQAQGSDTEDTNEEPPASAGEEPTPDEENERLPREGELSGAVEHRSIAARRRALSFLVLTTGGIDHDET